MMLVIAPTHLQVPGTFSVDEARRSYFGQLFPLNPGGIIPAGPTSQASAQPCIVFKSLVRVTPDEERIVLDFWDQDLRLNEPAGRGPNNDLGSFTHSRGGGSA
jgi:hypothetical protein